MKLTVTLPILLSCVVALTAHGMRVNGAGCDSIPTATIPADSLTADSILDGGWFAEITVKAPLVRREADRVVLNVAANPMSAGKNAGELLRTAPGVWADDASLSIYGQDGPAVYIDDRQVNLSGSQLITYLKSIRSESISTIEIIPKAGAEYSADTSGGIIRINLKRNRIDGLNGSAGMDVTAGHYKQWFNPNVNLGLHSGKWTVNLSGNLNGSPSESYTSCEESTAASASQALSGVSHHDGRRLQSYLRAGAFYEPDPRDRIGLQLDYNSDRGNHTSESATAVYHSGSPASDTFGRYAGEDHFHNLDAVLNWSHTLDDNGSELKFISDYNRRYSRVDDNNTMRWSDGRRDSVYTTGNTNRYGIFTTEISLRKIFSRRWTLNAGARYTLNDVAYTSVHHFFDGSAWVPDERYDYDTSYRENIAALYATFIGRLGRWRFKAGVRGEYFTSGGTSYQSGRLDIFPNANISFALTEAGDYTIALGYYRNIRRPSFTSLDPVVRQVSDYSYSVGNPALRPSYTDALSLDVILAGRFTVAAGISHTSDAIRQMFISNPDYPERMYLSWGNPGDDRSGFIHADGNMDITAWWNLYASLTGVMTSQHYGITAGHDTFGYFQGVASTTFRLPLGFNLSVNCFCQSKMKIGNISVYPMLNINPSIHKRFGTHWTTTLSLENMLQRNSRIRAASNGIDRLSHTRQHIAAKLSVTYNFNSGKNFRTPRIENNSDTSRLSKE